MSRRIERLNPPFMKHQQTTTVSRRQHEIMYDKKRNRSVFLRVLPGQTHNDKLMGQIKRTCRFVQQQDLGTRYKRLRHEHKLFLTVAQAAYRFSTQAIKPKLSQCVHHLFDLFIGHFPPEAFDQAEENHLKGRQTAGDGFKLRNIGDIPIRKEIPLVAASCQPRH